MQVGLSLLEKESKTGRTKGGGGLRFASPATPFCAAVGGLLASEWASGCCKGDMVAAPPYPRGSKLPPLRGSPLCQQ